MEHSLTVHQQTAMQIASSGDRISTAQRLVEFRLAKGPDGRNANARYKDGSDAQRISWLGDQFFGLSILAHVSVDVSSVKIDCLALDHEIMEDGTLRELTLAEIQEAFRKGINKEYGDYFGITSISMLGFLKGFLKSEKKQSATAIIYRHNLRLEQEANSRLIRELHAAETSGKVSLPDFSEKRVNAPQTKRIYSDEELAAHREKIRQQAEEIRRMAKMDGHGKQED